MTKNRKDGKLKFTYIDLNDIGVVVELYESLQQTQSKKLVMTFTNDRVKHLAVTVKRTSAWKSQQILKETLKKTLKTEPTDKECIFNRHTCCKEQFHAICKTKLLILVSC